ncbi:bifunctional 5,10-methylenetetrahydrofolate dehydrogenase/5,10-methenyltetrahydrofolate cyclohydrolase [Ureaplasma canigenitalium]|uniref:bifunctional 5,10-methylenetetrahydrofolate dehydrogenase/5,10-methenyltetrahydrofolate cyclohydrolase n=1 Tax=Ureaplasma canigenitalium TaxID=42092 RepID=UPI0004E0D20F|nr:bifunctional 5,10-methylenetetrahydrofolate dehydrogenase/5,10-methenyltetrahydrofolate cyclohydrolase [Ureaplasma canigenitalium]
MTNLRLKIAQIKKEIISFLEKITFSRKKTISIFYDSEAVDINSAYIKSKRMLSENYQIPIEILDLRSRNIEEWEKYIGQIASSHFLFFELPIPNIYLPLLNFLSSENDIDGLRSKLLNHIDYQSFKYYPATVATIYFLIEYLDLVKKDKSILFIGRSKHLGGFIYHLIEKQNGFQETMLMHTKTTDKKTLFNKADVVVSCINQANAYHTNQLKDNAVLIDGTFEILNGKVKGSFLIDHEDCVKRHIKYTPVPYGVGQLTTFFLLLNYISPKYGINFAKCLKRFLNTK